MKTVFCASFFLLAACLSFPARASGVEVVEGDKARALYEEQKDKAETLSQIDKKFMLKKPKAESVAAPQELTLAPGAYLFVTNDEEKTVHNVYDQSDHSWVLKKQLPSGVAAIKFTEPGVHELRCAIHPGMKITIKVDAAAAGPAESPNGAGKK